MEFITQLTVSAIVTLALYMFVAVGFSLNFAVGKVFNFALAAIFPLAGYITASLAPIVGLVLAIGAGLLGATVAGLLVEAVVFARLRSRGSSAAGLLLASLGIQLALQGLIGAIWGTNTVYVENPFPRAPLQVGPFTFGVLDIVTVATAAVVAAGLMLLLHRTNRGRTLLAVAEAPSTAAVVGIPVQRIRTIAAGLGTLIAAISSIFLVMESGLVPEVGNAPLLFAFASVVVGGIGKVDGTLLGLVLLVGASSVAVYFLPTFWMQGVTFVILLAFMLWRPRGLLGARRRSTQS